MTLVPNHGPAAPPDTAGSPVDPAVEPAPPPEPQWRFKKRDRPVKVVVLAGSIGAWPKHPYAWHFREMCSNVEVKNLSKVGQGAWALKQRFREQVLENRRINFGDDALEYWLVFQGGLNSVGMPEKTNRFMRDLFVLAHRRGIGVVGLTLTPWGDHSDARRWRGATAVDYLENTRTIVDFVMGRSSPRDALASGVERRKQPSAPWSPDELPDISIDLYDSPLRNATASAGSLDDARRKLEGDSGWKRAHADLEPGERAAELEADAIRLAEIPRWWMKAEYRAFDHIHPNTDGHQAIAEWACPALPKSWGCACPGPGARPGRRASAWSTALDPADPIR